MYLLESYLFGIETAEFKEPTFTAKYDGHRTCPIGKENCQAN